MICYLTSWAYAQDGAGRYEFHIEERDLGSAIEAIVRHTDKNVLFPYELADATGLNPVIGSYTLEEALQVLLQGTDFTGGLSDNGVMFIALSDATVEQDREGEVNTTIIKKGLLASVSAFLFGVGANGAALAQDGVDADESGHDTIIVTAQKREQRLQDVPLSLTVLGGEEIEARGITDIEDLGFAVPALTIRELGDQRQIAIRGVDNNFGPTPLTGVYVDEVPANGGQVGFGFDLPDLRLYDLERVEVLKGPQGTLFGQGSVGGTVRFITKKPDLNELQFKSNVELALTKDGAPSQMFQGALSVPLIEDKLAIRISPTWDNQDGWIDLPQANAKDANDQNVVNVRTNLIWRPVDNLDISAMAIVHQNDAGGLNRGENEDGNYDASLFGQGVSVVPTRTEDYELYNLTIDYDFAGINFVSSSSYTDRNASTSPFYDASLLILDYPVASEVFSQEVRLSSAGEGPLEWVIGGVYTDVDSSISGDVYFADPGDLTAPRTPDFVLLQETTSESWAVFGDISYDVTDRFEVGAGLRYFEDDRTFFDGLDNSASFDEISPRFYANYDISEDVTAYLNIAKGFRSGGFNAFGGAPYDPETVWTYDAGVRGAFLDGRLYVEASGYYSDYRNYLANSTPPGQILATFNNLAEVEILGGELAFTLQATDNLSLSFSANYSDSEIASLGGATAAPFAEGDQLDGIAPLGVTASIHQDFLFADKDAYFRLDYSHQDEIRRAIISPPESDVIDLFNAELGVDLSDDLSLSFFGRNLFNERSVPYPNGVLSPRLRPRTIGIRLGYELN